MAKLKAIEICRNLSSTIKSLEKTAPTVLYQLEEWKPPRATVEELRRVFIRISGKYKLTNKDIDIRKQGE